MSHPKASHPTHITPPETNRRGFIGGAGIAVASTAISNTLLASETPHLSVHDEIRLGLIGCGGRGSGAAINALHADPGIKLVAMADAFEDRLDISLQSLQRQKDIGDRVNVVPEMRFVGLDGYQKLLATDVDVVLLTTPPAFRPLHLRAAVEAGKHIFAEKPGAVDPTGVRSLLESTKLAKENGLFLVAGLHARYEPETIDVTRRIHDGAIGQILSARMTRYAQGLWVKPRVAGQTDVQYQISNWHYFTWLSGDFFIEQFVHEIDRMAWLMGDYPVSCLATGGRQARTEEIYGHNFDHFAALYKFANGAELYATTRQQNGCALAFEMRVVGTQGICTGEGKTRYEITGSAAWQTAQRSGAKQQGHQLEHNEFYKQLRGGGYINNGEYLAKSTLMGIMARESAYTGQETTWQQTLNAQQDLMPDEITFETSVPTWQVAVPGKTTFA